MQNSTGNEGSAIAERISSPVKVIIHGTFGYRVQQDVNVSAIRPEHVIERLHARLILLIDAGVTDIRRDLCLRLVCNEPQVFLSFHFVSV